MNLLLAEVRWPNDIEWWILSIGVAVGATICGAVFKIKRDEAKWLSFGCMVAGLIVVLGLYSFDLFATGDRHSVGKPITEDDGAHNRAKNNGEEQHDESANGVNGRAISPDRNAAGRPTIEVESSVASLLEADEEFAAKFPLVESLNQSRVSGTWVTEGNGKLLWVPSSVQFELETGEGLWISVSDSEWVFQRRGQ